MKKATACLFGVLLIAIALRLYPTVLTGMPFSTDAWPSIRNTELLLEKTPVQLGGGGVFDEYTIYWPASQVFGAVVSEVSGLPPIEAAAVYTPLAGSFAILIFYVLVRRLTQDESIGLLASLLFATAGLHSTFTAGVTKETYANPLYLLALYLLLKNGSGKGRLAAYALVFGALVASHHLTTLVFFVIAVSVALASILLPERRSIPSARQMAPYIAVALSITTAYYALYAAPGMVEITPRDWLSVLSFQTLMFAATVYVLLRPAPRRLPLAWVAPLLLIAVLIPINQRTAVFPGSPKLSGHLLIYPYAYLAIGFLALVGLFVMKHRGMDGRAYPLALWFSAMLGLEGYAVFAAGDLSLTLTYRLLNFLYPAAAALAAVAIVKARFLSGSRWSGRTTQMLLTSLAIAAVAISVHQTYAATVQQENYIGYQWLQRSQDYHQALWLKRHVGEDEAVAGDLKIRYLADSYMGVKVGVAEGYQYLARDKAVLDSGLLATYSSMRRNGYLLGPYGLALPEGWESSLENLDRVYSNGSNDVYVGGAA